ncbi:MAG: S8 family serine peptidase [candidate division WOR-3 bacterium]|nr:S8 family serine peptidase [candidate division WOR-3 bacterium]
MGRLVVRLRDRGEIEEFDFARVGLPQLKVVTPRFVGGFYELKVPEQMDPFAVASALEQTGAFDVVHFSAYYRVDATPNDTYYGSQWNLPKIQMPDAWDITTGSSDILLSIIDVGADYYHEDLSDNIYSGIGYDFYDNDPDPFPDDGAGHGTAVAGIAAARTNNSKGVAGVAGGWGTTSGVKLMIMDAGYINVYGWELIGVTAAARATDSSAAWGANVINMSFGGNTSWAELQEAINRAVNNYDVVIVASAGNNGGNGSEDKSIRYPAKYSNTIAVGATVQNDSRWVTSGVNGSAIGSELDVMAPGGASIIYTTDITGSAGYSSGKYYSSFGGTSASAPHVSGLAALILSVNENLDDAQVRDIIKHADDLGASGWDSLYGWGRINADSALLNTPSLTITPSNRYVSQYAGTTTYTIENEGSLTRDWSVTDNASWVTISPDSGTLAGGQTQTLTVTYGQNIRTAERTCKITLIYYVISTNVYLTQEEHPPTLSGNLPHNEIWIGNFTLTGDVTVPSGITLTIEPGSEITLPSGKEFYVYGTLLAEGTSSKRIVFNSQSSQNPHIVRFNNSSSSNSRLEYCRFQYANKGIYLYDSDADIKNCEIENCYYGIYNNQGRPLIDNNDITDCSYGIYNYNSQGVPTCVIKNNSIDCSAYGIYNYGASPDIRSNEVHGGAVGLLCDYYSSPILCGYSQPGYNYFHDNGICGLFAESNSNPFLGSDFCCLYGYNSFVGESDLGRVIAGPGCTVIAETNWWGTANPPSWWFSGNVDYIPYLTEPPSGGKWKASPEEEAFDIAFGDELPINKDNKNDDVMSYFNPDWSLIQQLRFAHTLIYNNYPEYACGICKNVIKTHPDSLQTLFALDLLWQASRLPDAREGYDMEAFEGYLYHLSEIEEKKVLYGSAELLLAFFEGGTGTPRIDKVFKEYRDTFLAEVALFQKFMYYFNEEDMENTIEVLNQLDYYFPGSSSAIQAHHLLGDEVGWETTPKDGKADQFEEIENTTQIPERFELLGSYPNPFSPSTTIRYSLPCFSKVEVTVFNSTGQVINHLTIPSKPAGAHQLTWNGTDNKGVDVPSGIYFINFKAAPIKESGEKFSKTVKLTLLR